MLNAVTGEELSAAARPVAVRNTVGAGDAMLAAVVAAVLQGRRPAAWLSAGVRAAAAAVRLAPGQVPTRSRRRMD